jgi:adenosylmethionine-8-amino-7-oxononanoate aminotransferase
MRRLPAYNAFDPFTNEPAERLADRLAGIAPVDDPRIFLTCDGSEAVDSAIKLARIAHVQAGQPERTIIVSRGLAYHGVTYGGLTAQGLPANQAGFGPLVPDFVNLPPNDLEAMATLFAEQGDRIAGVITEPIQGAGGVHPPVEGYLPGLRRLCDQHGAFLVMDEVICGFGRLGHWFGTERFGVRPDLITFAKGVSSGYIPVGGVVVGAAVRAPLEADPAFVLRHGHTYSGHAAAAAGALAALDITADEGLLDRAKPVGDRLADGLRSLAADGVVEQVRGDGAVWAVGLVPGRDPTAIRDQMLGLGVITRAIGTDTLSFCPPLVITDDEIDRVVDGLATALE